MQQLTQVATDRSLNALVYHLANTLCGPPIDYIRGSATYDENVGAAKYFKANTQSVALYMDIISDKHVKYVKSTSDCGSVHQILQLVNLWYCA